MKTSFKRICFRLKYWKQHSVYTQKLNGWFDYVVQICSDLNMVCEALIYTDIPLIPTDGAPAATADRAYSICTSLPEGLC